MKNQTLSRFMICSFLMALFLKLSSSGALACAACYGDTSGSKQGNAAAAGVFAMVIIMFAMLSAVGGFIWHLAHRAKHPLPDYSELLQEENEAPPKTV